ncbi:MAG: hypothetical protein ACPGTS_00220 [Minisyncoccia bacterium]
MKLKFKKNKTEAWFVSKHLKTKIIYKNISDVLIMLELYFKRGLVNRNEYQIIMDQLGASKLPIRKNSCDKDGEVVICVQQKGKISILYKKGINTIESFPVFYKQDALGFAKYFMKKFSMNKKNRKQTFSAIQNSMLLKS